MVPPLDQEPYPSLGGLVCQFVESNLVFGPGDLRGQPARLDAEKQALIYRAYEVFPRGHPQAGRRRFKRVAFSLRKGSAKTELAAWLAACELHPDGPVRCDGFDANGQPVGRGVTDPYIPMVAYTEEQSEELVYGALRIILGLSRLADDFDIGLARILRKGGDGKAEAVATGPNARDGARTTFQCMDETHRFTLPRLIAAHRTMLANIPKRRESDAWTLETTTAPSPGEGSVAENTMDYARSVAEGKTRDASLFFFHRQAADDCDLSTPDGIRAAVLEASGPVASWSDVDGIVDQWNDPTADQAYLRRVWLNQLVRSSERAFDITKWRPLARPDYVPARRALVTLGFDGSRYHDATAIVGTEIETGHQWAVGLWEQPFNAAPGWEVPAHEVKATIAAAFDYWDVWRMYADPPYWESEVAEWAGEYGEDRVWVWRTNRNTQMANAVRGYSNAILAGELTHDGSAGLTRHIGNACRRVLTVRDDQGKPLWSIYKERDNSPHKIDAAVAAVLSWEARTTAIAAGVNGGPSVYEGRGLLTIGAGGVETYGDDGWSAWGDDE